MKDELAYTQPWCNKPRAEVFWSKSHSVNAFPSQRQRLKGQILEMWG